MPRRPELSLLLLLVIPCATAAAGSPERPALVVIEGGRSAARAAARPKVQAPPSPHAIVIGTYSLTGLRLKAVGQKGARLSRDPAQARRWADKGGRVRVWDGKRWNDLDPQWLTLF